MNEQILSALNRLLAAESDCPAVRLLEGRAFVDGSSMTVHRAISRIAGENKEHARWLVELLLSFDAAPQPLSPSARCADLFYVDVKAGLPRVREGVEGALALAEKTRREVAPAAGRTVHTVDRILQRHREQIALLDELTTPA